MPPLYRTIVFFVGLLLCSIIWLDADAGGTAQTSERASGETQRETQLNNPCLPVATQLPKVEIPPEMGKLLIEDDRAWLGPRAVAKRWKSANPDPNTLYDAYVFDLNNDEVYEYLIATKPDGPSAVAPNNPVWVVQHDKSGFKEILAGFARLKGGPIVLKPTSHGYHDICIIQQDSAMDATSTIFRFNPVSSWYEESECWTTAYDDDGTVRSHRKASCD